MRERAAVPWAALAAAALAAAAVYSRSLGAGYLSLDDELHLLRNSRLDGFGRGELAWMWGLGWVHWYPLTWMSFALDRLAWGAGPFGHHLGNVLLHAVNAALAALLMDLWLARAGSPAGRGRAAAAAFGALLFALHPARAESVSWATERSDVLSASFILASTWLWARGRTGGALALHAAGLCAKAVGVTAPLAWAILDAAGLGQPWPGPRRAARELAPFLALSAASGALNALAQRGAGAPWSWAALGPGERLAVAAWNYWHGLRVTLWPFGLNAFVAMPKPFEAGAPRFLAAGALVLAASAAAWRARRRVPGLAAAWACYLLVMAPMAGFVKTGPQLSADRYAYLAALGAPALAAAALSRALRGPRARAAAAAAAALVLLLAALSWRRQADWLDSRRFWSAVLRADPRHAIARHFLGVEWARRGRLPEGEAEVRRAVGLDPGYAPAWNTLGGLLARQGRGREAVAAYLEASRLEPGRPEPLYNAALALEAEGSLPEAEALARRALEAEPGLSRAKVLLGRLLRAQRGRTPMPARTRERS